MSSTGVSIFSFTFSGDRFDRAEKTSRAPSANTTTGPIRRVTHREVTSRVDMAAKATPARPHRMMPASLTPSIFLARPISRSGRPTENGSTVHSTAQEDHQPVAAQNCSTRPVQPTMEAGIINQGTFKKMAIRMKAAATLSTSSGHR